MYFLKRNQFFNLAFKFMRLYSSAGKTHYEVLNLPKNCTDKEIKDAFIKKSKEYHPDKNKNAKAQENFVRVVEAYNILGKSSSRAQYDQFSETNGRSTYTYAYKTHTPYNWSTQANKQNYDASSNSYYGVKGVRKLPNLAIIVLCFGIAFIGIIAQIVVIKQSYRAHKRRNDERSVRLAEELEKVRAEARGKTRDMQTQLLLDKIVAAANPSVATASLGQTLADEKKQPSDRIQSRFSEGDCAYNLPVDNVKVTLYEVIKKVVSYGFDLLPNFKDPSKYTLK